MGKKSKPFISQAANSPLIAPSRSVPIVDAAALSSSWENQRKPKGVMGIISRMRDRLGTIAKKKDECERELKELERQIIEEEGAEAKKEVDQIVKKAMEDARKERANG